MDIEATATLESEHDPLGPPGDLFNGLPAQQGRKVGTGGTEDIGAVQPDAGDPPTDYPRPQRVHDSLDFR
jgi:hypothetical protein